MGGRGDDSGGSRGDGDGNLFDGLLFADIPAMDSSSSSSDGEDLPRVL